MTTTDTTTATVDASAGYVDHDQLTRAQKALMALTGDVARQLAEDHGVCVRPLALRRIDVTSGKVDVVPVPCGARREDVCRPCAEKNRRIRMAQCREGWHLEHEPIPDRPDPTAEQKQLMAARADLHAAYQTARADADEEECEEIRDTVAVVDDELRRLGVTGRLEPLDRPDRPTVKRSTRRRQDLPDLPRRPVEKRTLGQVFGDKYRPSTFLTLTLDSYGRVDGDGAAVDPANYDYRRAARDAIHFPKILDRFWQNTRRCVGWDVQYFGTIEPQRRAAPHFHAAIRGTIPRAELRAIAAATDHGVFWPAHDEIKYAGKYLPRWDDRTKGFVDPDTREPLPTWDPGHRPGHAYRAVTRRAVRRTGPREGHPRRHRGGRAAHRVPGQISDERRRPRGRPRRRRDRAAARAPPPPRRRTAHDAVLAALPGLADLRRAAQGRAAGDGVGAVQGQGPPLRTPRDRRAPGPGLAQVVGQDPGRSRG